MPVPKMHSVSMKKVLPHFHQYVCFAKRDRNILNLVRCNIKQAFRAAAPPHRGSSNYLFVMLIPAYEPWLIRKMPTVVQVRVWSEGAMEALQDCFECTNWDIFREAGTVNNGTGVDEYETNLPASQSGHSRC